MTTSVGLWWSRRSEQMDVRAGSPTGGVNSLAQVRVECWRYGTNGEVRSGMLLLLCSLSSSSSAVLHFSPSVLVLDDKDSLLCCMVQSAGSRQESARSWVRAPTDVSASGLQQQCAHSLLHQLSTCPIKQQKNWYAPSSRCVGESGKCRSPNVAADYDLTRS